MQTYRINLEVEAENQSQLEEKLQAFQDLQDNLSHDDLMQATEVVVENPALVQFIKDVAPEEGQTLSLMDYISIARKAYSTFA